MKTKCNLCGTESADEQWEMNDNLDLVCPACCGIIPVHATIMESVHTGSEAPSMNIQQIKEKGVIGTPMNGDLIEFRGKPCEVEIQGHQGAYRYIGGAYNNCAMSDHGFVKSGGIQYRCNWANKARILKRKFPELFPQESW